MNLNSHRHWRKTVIEHYGSIAAFRDGRTVRIMRDLLIAEENEDKRIRETIESHDGRKEWDEAFAEERADLATFKKELDDWLEAKDMEKIE